MGSTRTRTMRRAAAMAAVAAVGVVGTHPVADAADGLPAPHVMHVRDLAVGLGAPTPGKMVYGGGHVQAAPRIYMVYWHWNNHADPAATLMTNFARGLGGTAWAGIQTQYYESVNGGRRYIGNPGDQLYGVWFDDTTPIHDNLSPLEIAQEAQRAITHFSALAPMDIPDSDFVVATPWYANDAGFNQGGYCAWHDFSPNVGLAAAVPFSFTSMPYVLNAGAGCGKDAVNPAPGGDRDGFTIVLGHEVEETVTNPGAWNSADTGWGDRLGNETGDKCAWVGSSLLANPLDGKPMPVPGAVTDITLNDGRRYAVQSLWSNAALDGAGNCKTT